MAETDVVVVLASTLSCHIGRHSPDNSRTGLNNSIFCIPWGCDGQSGSRSVSAESVQINTDRRLSATARDVRSGVKLRRTQCEQMSSELPLKADIAQFSRHVSRVPGSDSCTAGNNPHHSSGEVDD